MQTNTKELQSQWIEDHSLCDTCLEHLKRNLEKNQDQFAPLAQTVETTKECWLCKGLFDHIPLFLKLIENEICTYEFSTFLLGCKLEEEIQIREEELVTFFQLSEYMSLKMELNRQLGLALEPLLKKEVSFDNPDIIAVVDTRFHVITLQIKPLYLYGRYQKLERGIPQTHWPCRICRGVGCRACTMTGKLYSMSVEELITKPLLEFSQAIDESFHGAGREDVDALMLGSGRPFVVELKEPKIRSINLDALAHIINTDNTQKIKVTHLRFSNKEEIIRLKKAAFRKQYRITIQAETPLKKEKLKEVAQLLPGTTIQQCTPTRVAHRRADKCRQRALYQCTVDQVEGTRAILVLEAESGTYVKEFVSGDAGRTQPNLSELLGTSCIVTALDVIAVQGE